MTMQTPFVYRFEPGRRLDATPLLLLHGTGGDENDLLSLGAMIAPNAPLLAPRGRVLENGMPRFFRRLAEGVFDEEDVRNRASELAEFAAAAEKQYGLPAPIAVGYSNGANIAAAMLLTNPGALAGAVLFRAMVPLAKPPQAGLAGTPVLITSGNSDPIVRSDNAARLAQMLSAAGANVEHKILPAGHQLSQADLTLAQAFLSKHTIPVEV